MISRDERWGGDLSCQNCGHPSGYHGATFCQLQAGAGSTRRCDCPGWSAALSQRDTGGALDQEELYRVFLSAVTQLHRDSHTGNPETCGSIHCTNLRNWDRHLASSSAIPSQDDAA